MISLNTFKKRIDELGRIVIPKQIRNTFKIKNFDNGELLQQNNIFMDYLQNGITVKYQENGEQRSTIVYLIDDLLIYIF